MQEFRGADSRPPATRRQRLGDPGDAVSRNRDERACCRAGTLNRHPAGRQQLLERTAAGAGGRHARARAGHAGAGAQARIRGPWSRIDASEPERLSELIAGRAAVRGWLMRCTIDLVTAADYARLWPLMAPVLAGGFRGSALAQAARAASTSTRWSTRAACTSPSTPARGPTQSRAVAALAGRGRGVAGLRDQPALPRGPAAAARALAPQRAGALHHRRRLARGRAERGARVREPDRAILPRVRSEHGRRHPGVVGPDQASPGRRADAPVAANLHRRGRGRAVRRPGRARWPRRTRPRRRGCWPRSTT